MNDIRVTQYALGELTGDEREKFERELAESGTLQRELTETIQVAEAILKLSPPADSFTDERRDDLRKWCANNLQARKSRPDNFKRVAVWVGVLGAAAGVAFALCMPAITGALVKADPARLAAIKAEREREIAALEPGTTSQAPSAPLPMATPSPVTMNVTDAAADLQKQVALNRPPEEKSAVAPSVPMAPEMTVATMPAESLGIPKQDQFAAKITSGNAIATFTGGAPATGIAGTGERRSAAIASYADADTAGEDGRLRDRVTTWRMSQDKGHNTEAYDAIRENVFLTARENPLSTFSIDVDTASYANVRRFLQGGQTPPPGAIRTEELINYFTYAYPQPEGDAPFSVNVEASHAPWDAKRELVRIGLKGREIPTSERGAANLVFLVDVSGSMDQPDKLPLLKRSLRELVENLAAKDRVAIVVYAGSSGLVLPSTPGTDKARILAALENLKAGGSTNGGAGIKLAYATARENFLEEGNNRVILCTDGDFNVGTTNQSELVRLIEKERASGVFLSVLGFGTGNLKDSTMEKLADKGNGNYAYIDSITEGRKVLVEQMGATLFTIAKDVKIQVEFNPARVAGYRLIGYENRLLAKEDFNDDKKDAGEIGAGHTVTALYEIIPAGQPLPDRPSVDPLKYQAVPAAEKSAEAASLTNSPELLTVKLRYKAPDGDTSKLIEVPLGAPEIPGFDQASSDFQFAAAVAAFGMKLRGSPAAGDLGWSDIQKIVRGNLGEDPGSYRAEFLTLIEKASKLKSAGREAGED